MEKAKEVDSKCRAEAGGAEKGKFIWMEIYFIVIIIVSLRRFWTQGLNLHVILTWEGG